MTCDRGFKVLRIIAEGDGQIDYPTHRKIEEFLQEMDSQ